MDQRATWGDEKARDSRQTIATRRVAFTPKSARNDKVKAKEARLQSPHNAEASSGLCQLSLSRSLSPSQVTFFLPLVYIFSSAACLIQSGPNKQTRTCCLSLKQPRRERSSIMSCEKEPQWRLWYGERGQSHKKMSTWKKNCNINSLNRPLGIWKWGLSSKEKCSQRSLWWMASRLEWLYNGVGDVKIWFCWSSREQVDFNAFYFKNSWHVVCETTMCRVADLPFCYRLMLVLGTYIKRVAPSIKWFSITYIDMHSPRLGWKRQGDQMAVVIYSLTTRWETFTKCTFVDL